MIELAAVWILSLQLTSGGDQQLMSFETERQCVTVGEKLSKQARKRALTRGRRPPPGWICIEDVKWATSDHLT
jgi:hypothetical protein